MEQNRLDILKKVEMGEISLEEASDLLTEIETNQFTIQEHSEVIFKERIIKDEPADSYQKEKPAWSIVFWVIPILFGVLLTVFSSTWLYQNYLTSGLGFKFWFTWIPFFIGVFLIYFGWILQRARWIHLHIKQPKGESPQRIFLAFPLPFQLIGFFLKIFKGKMPSKVSGLDIEELLMTIDQQLKKDEPLYVHVDDEDGTKVEIYIG
jgi:hypothetical protein